jgi:hypothetical protein
MNGLVAATVQKKLHNSSWTDPVMKSAGHSKVTHLTVTLHTRMYACMVFVCVCVCVCVEGCASMAKNNHRQS